MMTNFGYSILDVATMPEILSVEDFNSMTANKYALDARVADTIKSVTAAIRTYCGWHIAPSLKSELVLNVEDLTIYRKYNDVSVSLPYTFISSIDKVYINAYKEDDEWTGDECEFSYKHNGQITLYDAFIESRKSNIVIIANVGLVDDDALKSVIANKVSQVLNGTFGVQSESAGSVSITYSSSYINGAKSTSFMTDDRELLNNYKIRTLL